MNEDSVQPAEEDALPERVHHYRVLGRLGAGGFADVYLACPAGSFRPVALKVLREEIDDRVREQVLARFHAEENIAKAIDHPAIVRIRETSPLGASPAFIAMEYVEGQPFCEYFQGQPEPLDLGRVARLAYQVACAMAEAHARGIVHRDLKPDNVLVTSGSPGEGGERVKILDFGIAKAPLGLFSAAQERAVTRYVTELGTVMGSPPYMAPEQNGAAHAVTGKADVYALGMMLLLVVCRLDDTDVMGEHSLVAFPERIAALIDARGDVPGRWRALLRDLLAIDARDRPDMSEVARRLQRLGQPHEPFAAAVETWLRTGRVPPARRLRSLAAWAEGASGLTPDEQRFLRQAPQTRWRRSRGQARVFALASLVLPAAVGVALTLMGSTPPPGAPLAFIHASIPAAAHPPLPAPQVGSSCPASSVDPAAAMAEAAAARRDLAVCRAAHGRDQATLEAQQKRLAGQRAQLESKQAQLESKQTALTELEVEASASQGRISSLEQELERSRDVAAEEGKQAFACRQKLESANRQLSESMDRWRVCARGLRARGGSIPSAPEPTSASEPVSPEPTPPPAPTAAPGES